MLALTYHGKPVEHEEGVTLADKTNTRTFLANVTGRGFHPVDAKNNRVELWCGSWCTWYRLEELAEGYAIEEILA